MWNHPIHVVLQFASISTMFIKFFIHLTNIYWKNSCIISALKQPAKGPPLPCCLHILPKISNLFWNGVDTIKLPFGQINTTCRSSDWDHRWHRTWLHVPLWKPRLFECDFSYVQVKMHWFNVIHWFGSRSHRFKLRWMIVFERQLPKCWVAFSVRWGLGNFCILPQWALVSLKPVENPTSVSFKALPINGRSSSTPILKQQFPSRELGPHSALWVQSRACPTEASVCR